MRTARLVVLAAFDQLTQRARGKLAKREPPAHWKRRYSMLHAHPPLSDAHCSNDLLERGKSGNGANRHVWYTSKAEPASSFFLFFQATLYEMADVKDSLVRYDSPSLASSKRGKSKAPEKLDSRATEEDILSAIMPPREWVAAGQTWVQSVSSIPAGKIDVIALQVRV